MRDNLPPFRPDVRVLFGKYLFQLGLSSDLIGPGFQNEIGERVWPAGRCIATGKRGGILGELLKPVRDFVALLKAGRHHDIIQVRDKTISALVACVYAKVIGKPFVFWMSFPMVEGYEGRAREVGFSQGIHMWVANGVRARIARSSYYGFVIRHADHIFVQSDAMLDWMVEKGVSREAMTAVPMGVDVESVSAEHVVASNEARLHGRRVVVYLGALGSARQPAFFFDVVELLRESVPDVLLVLVGDGNADDEKAWLRREIEKRGLSHSVWLTGWLPQDQALSLVKAGEVGLSPIPRGVLYDVSSPTKALEYLALEVPCVGSDIPDQKWVLEQSQGGVCVEMKPHEFADAVLALLNDPLRAHEMGKRGAEFVRKERSYDVISRRVMGTYLRILERL